MRKIPNTIYPTADELEASIKERQAQADAAGGQARQTLLKDIDQLRMHAAAGRAVQNARTDLRVGDGPHGMTLERAGGE